MSKGFLFGVVLIFFSGCVTQRKICPAYQSAFIFDQAALRKKFSYFENDSTPKVYTASRTSNLIIPEESYRKKLRSLQTIEMKPVYTVLPDTSKGKGKKDGDFYKAPENIDSLLRTQTRDVVAPVEEAKPKADSIVRKDSVEVDSSYQISKDKEVRFYRYHADTLRNRVDKLRNKSGEELKTSYSKYRRSNDSAMYRVDNIRYRSEQELYMYYLRDVLVLPDVRAAMNDEKQAKADSGKVAKTEKPDSLKGFKGFLRGLKGMFKKKPKSDSTNVSSPDLPVVQENSEAVPDSTLTKKQRKKLQKQKAEAVPVDKKPSVKKKDAIKKKEEDDGF